LSYDLGAGFRPRLTVLIRNCSRVTGELLFPIVVKLESALGSLGSKEDGLGCCGVDIVIEEVLLIAPEGNAVVRTSRLQ
jgi:hypothetical protein